MKIKISAAQLWCEVMSAATICSTNYANYLFKTMNICAPQLDIFWQ